MKRTRHAATAATLALHRLRRGPAAWPATGAVRRLYDPGDPMRRPTHERISDERTRCGLLNVRHRAVKTTLDPDRVTCQRCRAGRIAAHGRYYYGRRTG